MTINIIPGNTNIRNTIRVDDVLVISKQDQRK